MTEHKLANEISKGKKLHAQFNILPSMYHENLIASLTFLPEKIHKSMFKIFSIYC